MAKKMQRIGVTGALFLLVGCVGLRALLPAAKWFESRRGASLSLRLPRMKARPVWKASGGSGETYTDGIIHMGQRLFKIFTDEHQEFRRRIRAAIACELYGIGNVLAHP